MTTKFEMNTASKGFYSLVFIGIFLTLGVSVLAYQSGLDPSVFGHSGEEIEISIGGAPVTLQYAIDNLLIGGGGSVDSSSAGLAGLIVKDIASGKGITVDDLLTEIETIVDSGTKINLSYLINEILEDYQLEELNEVLTESEEASFNELREEFNEDEYTDEELRMTRIQFISHMGN